MWVFCGGMQRSGSTLQFQITAHLVEMVGKGQRQAWVPPDKIPSMIQNKKSDPVMKVVKTHVYSDDIAHEFYHANALGVYCFRDLRDVVVSFIHKENRTFESDWVTHNVQTNIDRYEQWTTLPRVLVSKYEEMILDLPREVERIAHHLGITITSQQAVEIAALYTLDKQKETIQKASEQGRLTTPLAGVKFDPHSLLHSNHIHSGEIGGWKHTLTPDQVRFVEKIAANWLIQNGYELASKSLG